MKAFRLTAAALALTTALGAAMPAPAEAGGRITTGMSIEITPQNRKEERALRTGLAIYGLARGIESGAFVNQRGGLNAAAVAQSGLGNAAVIEQRGRNHEASIEQNGNGNAYGIFQFGRGATGHATQQGNGNTGVLIQFAR